MFGIEALDVVISLIFVYLLFSLFVSIVNEMLSQVFKIRGKELRFSIERMVGKKLRDKFYNNPKIDKTKYRSSFWYGTPFWKLYLWFRDRFSKNVDLKSDDVKDKIVNKSYPSEIAPSTFADTLIRILQKDEVKAASGGEQVETDNEAEQLKEKLFEQAPFLRKAYLDANKDLEAIRGDLEDWFDEIMGYTSEWYKQKLRYVLIFLGFVTAVIFNVDSIAVFKTLTNEPETRNMVVQQAESFIESHHLENGVIIDNSPADTLDTTPDTLRGAYAIRDFLRTEYQQCQTDETEQEARDCIDSVNNRYPTLVSIDSTYQKMNALVNEDIEKLSSVLGLGWRQVPPSYVYVNLPLIYVVPAQNLWFYVKMIFGWMITAIAISLGAPFWFDLLKKVINLKNQVSGKKSSTSRNGKGALG